MCGRFAQQLAVLVCDVPHDLSQKTAPEQAIGPLEARRGPDAALGLRLDAECPNCSGSNPTDRPRDHQDQRHAGKST